MNSYRKVTLLAGLGALSIVIAALLLVFTVSTEGEPTAVALALLAVGIGLVVFSAVRRRRLAVVSGERGRCEP